MTKSFLSELSDFSASLTEGKRLLFSPPLHWVSLANGDADFQDNVIFFGFDERKPDPVLVAKVPRLAKNGWMLRAEYEHLLELWSCMGTAAENYIPKPYALPTLQERPVLMISYVSGESLTRLSPKTFWADSAEVTALAREAARTLLDLNRLTERTISSPDTFESDFHAKADKFRELFSVNTEEDDELLQLTAAVNETSKTASHEVLIQGDFWHGNMIRDKKRGRLMFVDWQFARWSTDVSLDFYFFLLAGALSAAGSGAVKVRAKQAFQTLMKWRMDVMPEYFGTYGKPDHYVLLPQKYGMMLCCVEKAVRSALDFGYSHPDDLLWRHLFAELQKWPAEY